MIHQSATARSLGLPQGNYAAVSDPTTADDVNHGYSNGSTWINANTGQICTCVDPSAGAAVWVNVGTQGNQGAALSYYNVNIAAARTTTSSTYVGIAGMLINVPPGTYYTVFNGSTTNSNATATIMFALFLEETATALERSILPRASTVTVTVTGFFTAASSQNVSIRWNTSLGTSTVHHMDLALFKIA